MGVASVNGGYNFVCSLTCFDSDFIRLIPGRIVEITVLGEEIAVGNV